MTIFSAAVPTRCSSWLNTARALSDTQVANFHCVLPIKQRIAPTFCQLIRDLNGLRICLGNWSPKQTLHSPTTS